VKTVTFYPYDAQLSPGEIGADFDDGDPNHAYTLRYQPDEVTNAAEEMGRAIIEWINGKAAKA